MQNVGWVAILCKKYHYQELFFYFWGLNVKLLGNQNTKTLNLKFGNQIFYKKYDLCSFLNNNTKKEK